MYYEFHISSYVAIASDTENLKSQVRNYLWVARFQQGTGSRGFIPTLAYKIIQTRNL